MKEGLHSTKKAPDPVFHKNVLQKKKIPIYYTHKNMTKNKSPDMSPIFLAEQKSWYSTIKEYYIPRRASSPIASLKQSCCSVLQCVVVCCSALQCVAVRCSALQCVAVRCSVLQSVAIRCSVSQFWEPIKSVLRAYKYQGVTLQRVAVSCSL